MSKGAAICRTFARMHCWSPRSMLTRLAQHCLGRGLLLAALSVVSTAPWAAAQAPAPVLTAVSLPPAANDREQVFAELQRDVVAMDRELSIYKRVVQLVAPSVVHVQAKPLAEY